MGGANGSREGAPDDKLSDTHQLHLMEMMGFAGSTHPYVLYACLPVCDWVAFSARCGLDFCRTKEERNPSPVNTEQRDAPSFTAE
jgi:hypothetical protein